MTCEYLLQWNTSAEITQKFVESYLERGVVLGLGFTDMEI